MILVALTGAASLLASAAATAAPPRFQGYVRGAVTGPGGDKRCWHRTTGATGHISRIGTDAPGRMGSYIVKWIVNDRVVAHWRFFNHVGD